MLGAALAQRYDRVLVVVGAVMIVSQYALYWACNRWIPQLKLNADAVKHHGKGGKMGATEWSAVWKELSAAVWCACFHIAFSSVAVYGAGCYVFATSSTKTSE